ncbi:MAG: G protein-coupled seven transmembrane receptor [Monoraphidium minutum]|nr:MAG: G protein-coupled seven transmembrane receptor [Monoraphidium minutum]
MARRSARCSRAALPLALALLAAVMPQQLEAKVTYSQLFRDDRSLVPVAPDFAFAERGRIDIVLSEVTIWQRHEEERDVVYDDFGLFLAPMVEEDDEMSLEAQALSGVCLLTAAKQEKLFTFANAQVARLIQGQAGNATMHIDVENGGWYTLYFANCDGAAVSLRATVAMYNLRPDGSRDYLPVGETELDAVYWVMFALFAGMTAAWCGLLVVRRPHVHGVHLLMGVLVLFKALTLLAQALMTLHIEATGGAEGWNFAYYVFTAARGLLFFTVVVLLGAGWSVMKPFLDDNTKTILLGVVPLQVLANVALVFIDEESPAMRDWLTWRDIFHIIDIACCCAILFPIVWQIRQLRDAAGMDGKAARSLIKLRLFRSFYATVVAYVYFTRVIVYLLRNFVSYRYAWTSDAVAEVAALAFYTWVGASFRPAPDNRYLHLSQEDIELATAY